MTKDTSTLTLTLMNANVRMIQPGWLMSPRTKVFLAELRDGNGNKAFPEIDNNTFRDYKIGVTTNIPINLAVTGSNESELYFAVDALCKPTVVEVPASKAGGPGSDADGDVVGAQS